MAGAEAVTWSKVAPIPYMSLVGVVGIQIPEGWSSCACGGDRRKKVLLLH